MSSDDLKQFMKPKTNLGLVFSIVDGIAGILGFCIGEPLAGIFALVLGAFFFYCFVFFEWKVYRKDLKNYETEGQLEKLTADFYDSRIITIGQEVRFGKQYLFIHHESKVYKYDEIIALQQRFNKKEKSLRILSQGSEYFLPYHSLSWSMSNPDMERIVSELTRRNPNIKVVQENM